MMLWFYEPSHITSTCLTSHQPSPEHIHLPHVTTACLVSPQPAHIVPTHPVSDKPIPYHMDPSHSTPSHPTSGQFTSHHTNHDAYTHQSPMQPSPRHLPPSHPTQAISILSRGGTMPTWNSTIPMYCAALGAPVLSLCPTRAIHPTLQHLPGCT